MFGNAKVFILGTYYGLPSRYKFSEEEITAIQEAGKKNKDKRAEQQLKAMELRAKGSSAKEVATATGFCVRGQRRI